MNKKQLKEKLELAGVDSKLIDERLAAVTEKQLESIGDEIPEATLLKELKLEAAADDSDVQTFVLDEAVLKDFGKIVKAEVKEAIDNLEIELAVPEMKELSELGPIGARLDGIEASITELKELVTVLAQSDDKRLKEMLNDAPRSSKFRIMRFKATNEEDVPEDDETAEEDMPPAKGKKKELDPAKGLVVTPDGTFGSLTESLGFGGQK